MFNFAQSKHNAKLAGIILGCLRVCPDCNPPAKSREARGDGRHRPVEGHFFINKFKKLGFIDFGNGNRLTFIVHFKISSFTTSLILAALSISFLNAMYSATG
jgi:hypothetical protein